MYICKNCAGHLKYDIKEEKLVCESCNSMFPIGEIKESKQFEKDKTQKSDSFEEQYIVDGAEVSDTYETYIFTCPQCGGEIRCDYNEAATFCPYCGASNVLEGRLAREKKTEYIIPFKIDKEKCKEIYKKYAKRKIFAPSDITKEGVVDGFRGIYMPYWSYEINQSGNIELKGEQTRYSGNYTYYDEYKLEGIIDGSYEGIVFDASSSFYDDYSQCISPFDIKDIKNFDSSYMAGFYADTYDVDGEIYEEEALDIAGRIAYDDYVKKGFSKKIKEPVSIPNALNTRCSEKKSALLPVWFMAYKYKGRILYSAINGQTGEIAADIPISIKKYIIGSLILCIPIFIVLNMFLSLNGPKIALLASLTAIIAGIIYAVMSSKLRKIESKEKDKGYVFAHRKEFESDFEEKMQNEKEIDGLKKEIFSVTGMIVIVVVAVLVFSFLAVPAIYLFVLLGTDMFIRILGLISLVANTVVFIINLSKKNKSVRNHRLAMLFPFTAGLVSSLMLIVSPAFDMFYYIAAVVTLSAMIVSVIVLADRYNELISRPMPQFKREGGDDNA